MQLGPTLFALVLGLLTGAVEVLSRYDEPFKAVLRTLWGWLYLLLNAGLGVAAYAVLVPSMPDESHWKLALYGGLGAAAVVRARISTVRVGEEEVAVGPAFLVDGLLKLLDRQIDRARALQRTRIVVREMAGIGFPRVAQYARTLILGSRQSLSAKERAQLREKIAEIEGGDEPDAQKAHALGFAVLDFMGETFLAELAAALRQNDAPASTAALGGKSGLVRSGLGGVRFAEATRRFDVLVDEDESLTTGERAELRAEVQEIAGRDIPENDKSLALGFLALNFFGRSAFEMHFPSSRG